EALTALDRRPSLTPWFFIDSDEEIGSRESRRYLERLARGMDRVFVLEPSLGRRGRLKTSRKGGGLFQVEVKGRAAHAGLDPESGASAILELSYAIQALFALNDPHRGVTVNVGQVDGGLRPNVVAPAGRAVVDVRVARQEDAVEVEKAIFGLQPHTPGVSLKVSGGISRPPMEETPRNLALFRRARELGKLVGLDLEGGQSGGGSDGNFTSLFAATLDGLGAVGGGAHADHEFIEWKGMAERTALLALLLLEPPREVSRRASAAPGKEA
ncbi:MAG: M20/M25/M40 family metallo-hydrolase, partial [Acidobacteria bacterium]|nr:M20/M25/M40 family metallo-hydrolase [Acidobacteriota bacterium]